MLIDLFPDGPPTTGEDAWASIVADLLRADAKGHHCVVMDLATLEQVARVLKRTHGEIGGNVQRLRNRASERENVLRTFPVHVRVESRDIGGVTGDVNNPPFRVSWRWFQEPTRCRGTRLVTEAECDFDFYLRIASDWLSGTNKGGERFCAYAQRSPGGGGNLARRIEESLNTDDATLAIADSDVKRPGGQIGPTAQGAAKVDLRGVAHRHIDRRWRELENLFPQPLIEQFARVYPDYRERVTDLADAGALGPRDAPYWDLKKGIYGRDVLHKRVESDVRTWREDQLSRLPARLSTRKDRWCDGAAACEQNHNTCHCHLVDGLGEKFADNFVDWLKTSQPKLCTTSDPTLAELGRLLAPWTLAPYPRLA